VSLSTLTAFCLMFVILLIMFSYNFISDLVLVL